MSRLQSRIMYVECATDLNHRGRARICRVWFSRSGRSVYVGNMLLTRANGVVGNFVNSATGIEYWVSGPKKNGQDRHWAGGGRVQVEPDVVDETWQRIRGCDPPADPFWT